MKVLITGAAGYIGRWLTWRLQDRHELVLTDVMQPDPDRIPWVYGALNVERRPEFTPHPNPKLPFIIGDLLEMGFCERLLEGVDAVIHLSASVKHDEVIECFRDNALSTFQILEACARQKVGRALIASSINASGWFYCRATDRPRNWPYLPVDEDYPVDHEDAYSLSKYLNELNAAAWTRRTGLTTAAFRFAGVFPPEWTETHHLTVQPTEAWPDTLADYVDLRDVVQGLIDALECPTLPASGVYQLTAPDTRLPEPTMEIIERFRPELLKLLRRELPGRSSMLSWQRAHEAFGYTPRHCWKPV